MASYGAPIQRSPKGPEQQDVTTAFLNDVKANPVFMEFYVKDICRYEEVKRDAIVLGDRLKNSIYDTSVSERTRSEPIPLAGKAMLDVSNRRPGATKI